MQANSQNYVISLSRLFSTRSNFSNAYTFNYDSFLYHYLLKKLVIYAKLSTNEAQIGDNITWKIVLRQFFNREENLCF